MKNYLNQHMKIREKNLKYDFLPPMLEIIERPANRLADVILLLIAALVVTAFVWAKCCRLDITVKAYGVMGSNDAVISLASVYGGTVSEIYVKENQWVEAGTPIWSMDRADAERATEQCLYELGALQTQREVYAKVYEEDTEGIDTAGYGEYAMIAEAILLENDLYREQLENSTAKSEKENLQKEHQLSILQNINSIDVKIQSTQTELESARHTLEELTVKAPVSGTVIQMTAAAEGVFLAAGEKAAYLIPDNKDAVFTAYVTDEEIERIHTGDTVHVRIGAYDGTQYEYLDGTVKSVGGMTYQLDGIGTAYQVGIELSELPEDEWKTGLEGTCEVVIGTRSVLDYFLEPFLEGLEGSMKEV